MESTHQDELSPMKEIYLLTKLSEIQFKMYKEMISKLSSAPLSDNKNIYLNILMFLRKVCNHPYLFDDVEDNTLPALGDHLITTSGKMMVLDKLLEKLEKEKHQVVIISQMVRMLDILEDYCQFRKYNYCRIDGSTEKDARIEQINEFVKVGSEKFVFLLSSRAGGLGMNLSSADTVIFYDSDWNLAIDDQNIKKVHLVGQKSPVTVYRLVNEFTIEERILEILNEKRREKEDKALLGVDQLSTIESILSIINHGSEKLFSESSGSDLMKMIDEEGIDEYLKESEMKTWEMDAKFDVMFNKDSKYEQEDLNLIKIFWLSFEFFFS